MRLKFILPLATLLYIFQCGSNTGNGSFTTIPISDWNGKKTTISAYSGKYVILDVWATWCEPCKEAVPVVERIKKDLRKENFVILGINTDSGTSMEMIQKSAQDLGMTYPSLLDSELKLSTSLGVQGIPAFFIIDPKGKIIYRQDGLIYKDYPTIMSFIYKSIGKG